MTAISIQPSRLKPTASRSSRRSLSLSVEKNKKMTSSIMYRPSLADDLISQIPSFPSVFDVSPPSLSPSDGDSITTWISVNGNRMPAIAVGGEPRIPMALYYKRSCHEYDFYRVERMIGDLCIHKTIASPPQEKLLRSMDSEVSRDSSASVCVMIGQSDAERVLGLLRKESRKTPFKEPVPDETERLSVEHKNYGSIRGYVYPSRGQKGRCVRCVRCMGWFTPPDFISHSHLLEGYYKNLKRNKGEEIDDDSDDDEEVEVVEDIEEDADARRARKHLSSRVSHWGLEPYNWRLMLNLTFPSSESAIDQQRWAIFIDAHIIYKGPCKRNNTELMPIQEPIAKQPKLCDDSLKSSSHPIDDFGVVDIELKLVSQHLANLLSYCGQQYTLEFTNLLAKEKEFIMKQSDIFMDPTQPSTSSSLNNIVPPPVSVFPPAYEKTYKLLLQKEFNAKIADVDSRLNRLDPSELPIIKELLNQLRMLYDQRTLLDDSDSYNKLRIAYDFLYKEHKRTTDPGNNLSEALNKHLSQCMLATSQQQYDAIKNPNKEQQQQQIQQQIQKLQGLAVGLPCIITPTAAAIAASSSQMDNILLTAQQQQQQQRLLALFQSQVASNISMKDLQ